MIFAPSFRVFVSCFTHMVVVCMEAYIAGVLIDGLLYCIDKMFEVFFFFFVLILVGYGIGEDVLM